MSVDLLTLSSAQAINLANVIINDKTKNLRFDVTRCMVKDKDGNAPLSALLYCFSMIDFMGSLYSGEGGNKDKNNKNVNTTKNAENYATQFLGYSQKDIKIIWQMFRHKTTHISMPETVFDYDGNKITWDLNDDDYLHHLKTIGTSTKGIIPIGNTGKRLLYDYKYVIHIPTLSEDIIKSMQKYLNSLTDPKLVNNFKMAVNEIYAIKKVKI